MSGKVAVVTGGTRGIGGAISKALKNQGYKVAATFLKNEKMAQKFSQETGVSVFQWDVCSYEACELGTSMIVEKMGPVDVLINNAGITWDGFFHKMLPQQWHDVINTNLHSMFNMSRCVLPSMRSRHYGRIINISSINGQKGQIGQVNYATSKAGVIGFTKALALENASKNVTVNCIAPGYIRTEMVDAVPQDVLSRIIDHIPVGRLGEVEEIAGGILYLLSDQANFITGTTLSINGGQNMV